MGETFYVLGCTADGTTFDGPLTREELGSRLSSGYYGARNRFALKNPGTDGFCIRLRDDELLIIKGHVVQPKAIEVVAQWELP